MLECRRRIENDSITITRLACDPFTPFSWGVMIFVEGKDLRGVVKPTCKLGFQVMDRYLLGVRDLTYRMLSTGCPCIIVNNAACLGL